MDARTKNFIIELLISDAQKIEELEEESEAGQLFIKEYKQQFSKKCLECEHFQTELLPKRGASHES